MPKVRALVFDLARFKPKAGDRFLVDTNVWFWVAYPGAPDAVHKPLHYQIEDYPAFLKSAVNAAATLHWCGLCWAELAHVIETTEHKLAKGYGAIPTTATVKDYRHHYPEERARVAAEIKSAWDQVNSFATTIGDTVVNGDAVRIACEEVGTVGLDAYDLFLLQTLRKAEARGIITDDSDFASVPKINVLTANPAVLDAAKRAGRLAKCGS